MASTSPALYRRRNFVIGGGLTAAFLVMALLSLLWTPHAAGLIDISARLRSVSGVNWLGTDHFGRDVASMIMVGARNSVLVAMVAVGFGIALGVPLGALAAARRGWLDETVMRFNDLVFAFPALLTAVMITALAGPGSINSILAIGLFNVPVFARVARAAALALWRREFVRAAQALGLGPWAITRRHILPNMAGLLIVQATIQFAWRSSPRPDCPTLVLVPSRPRHPGAGC